MLFDYPNIKKTHFDSSSHLFNEEELYTFHGNKSSIQSDALIPNYP